jgi:hypothetical protein
MAGFLDDDRVTTEAGAASPLDRLRRAQGAQRNETTSAWLGAGENLAEKALAALDTGEDADAERLVRRILALPVDDEGTRTGLMAVSLLLYGEVLDPGFEVEAAPGLLDLPLRLLPTLDAAAANELRHVLAALTEYDLPAAMVRRIRDVVPLERRLEPPFAGVPEQSLADAITGVLRLVLRLRTEG